MSPIDKRFMISFSYSNFHGINLPFLDRSAVMSGLDPPGREHHLGPLAKTIGVSLKQKWRTSTPPMVSKQWTWQCNWVLHIYIILLANIIWMIWSVKPSKFQGQSIDDEKRVGFPLDVLRSMMKREVPIVSIVVHWREGFPRFSYQGRWRARVDGWSSRQPATRTWWNTSSWRSNRFWADSGSPSVFKAVDRRAQPEIRKKLVVNGCDTCTATKNLDSFLDIKWPNCLLWTLRYFEDILKALFHSNCNTVIAIGCFDGNNGNSHSSLARMVGELRSAEASFVQGRGRTKYANNRKV